MLHDSLFSSKYDSWETPQDLFDSLDREFNFTWDLAASHSNAKCTSYFTKEDDALKQHWSGVCFCNPPYGRSIKYWVEKAFWSSAIVVMLIPARTDTEWFHKYIWKNPNVEIRFIRRRLRFGNSLTDAPFPSMICIFRNV